MALAKLKALVNNNMKPSKEVPEIPLETEDKKDEKKIIKITYEEWGFESAGKSHGFEIPFRGWLNLVREHFRKEAVDNEIEMQKAINDAQNELDKRKLQISNKENEISNINEKKISNLKEKIENLKKDIIRIKENPEELLKDKLGKAGLVIGGLILVALTVYLFIFYSSAFYSGFLKDIKDFVDSDGMASSIFDPNAIGNAYKKSIANLILILTIPSVFLGLGYLIHKFQEKKNFKNYLKITGLIIVTFIFDCILAYEITEKIYDVKNIASTQMNIPDYSVSLAFHSVNFWVIIFAGFVVYLIWGFVFDFVMESYDKLDFVKQAIKAKETEIKLYEEDIVKNQSAIDFLNKEIEALKLECKNFEKIISGNTIIINWEGYKKCVFEFVSGWGHWMTANKKALTEINNIHSIADEFVNKEKVKLSEN